MNVTHIIIRVTSRDLDVICTLIISSYIPSSAQKIVYSNFLSQDGQEKDERTTRR